MFKKPIQVLGVCLMAFVAVACQSETAKKANTIQDLLNSSGTTYKLVKADTNVSGFSVFQDMSTGDYVAINVAKFNPQTMTTLAQFQAALVPGDYVDNLSPNTYSWYVSGYWVNDGYYDPAGYWVDNSYYVSGYWASETDYERGNYSFENKRTSSKDLESFAANAAKADAKVVQAALVSQYGFSVDRAAAVATMTKQMKEISGTRELTDADKSLFTQQTLGVDYKALSAAIQKSDQGNAADFNKLIGQAAAKNGTSPEAARQLIMDVSAGQAQ